MNYNQQTLVFDPNYCMGCRICELACSFRHYGSITPLRSHIHTIFDTKANGFELSSCWHCDEPLCKAACPVQAIVKDEATGIVKLNPLICIACGACKIACPIGLPWYDDSQGVYVKCDFCEGEPACVKFCPSRALRIAPREEAMRLMQKLYA
jgi:Fe-S-cluster-containing dehydrogenase component